MINSTLESQESFPEEVLEGPSLGTCTVGVEGVENVWPVYVKLSLWASPLEGGPQKCWG